MDQQSTDQTTTGRQLGITVSNWIDAEEVPRVVGADGLYEMPGAGRIPARLPLGRTKFLGSHSDGDAGAPWIFLFQKPSGEVTPWRHHSTDHLELVLSGEIEWHDEEGRTATRLGPGSVLFVPAGRRYRYTVLTPADLLVLWYGHPDVIADGMPYLALDEEVAWE